MRRAAGLEQLPAWHKLLEHPSYDSYWQQQGLDKLLARLPAINVPVMWEQGLWDQEDMYGKHAWAALESQGHRQHPQFPGDWPVAAQPTVMAAAWGI